MATCSNHQWVLVREEKKPRKGGKEQGLVWFVCAECEEQKKIKLK